MQRGTKCAQVGLWVLSREVAHVQYMRCRCWTYLLSAAPAEHMGSEELGIGIWLRKQVW